MSGLYVSFAPILPGDASVYRSASPSQTTPELSKDRAMDLTNLQNTELSIIVIVSAKGE